MLEAGLRTNAEATNKTDLINKLPCEILILIFQATIDFDNIEGPEYLFTYWGERKPTPSVVPLLRLTHVCRRWRQLAIRFPRFWTRIDSARKEQMDTFLRRTQFLPLSLFLDIRRPWDLGAEYLLVQNGHRVRRLSISSPEHRVDYSAWLGFEPRRLECIVLHTGDSGRGLTQPHELVERLLFGSLQCNLSALALNPVTRWVPANEFPRLTHLYLAFRGLDEPADVSMVIRLLRRTPSLEHLHLVDLGWIESDSRMVEAVGVADLPRLRSCILNTGELQIAVTILSFLSLSPNVWIRMSDMEYPLDASQRLPPLPALPVLETVTRVELATEPFMLHLVAVGPTGGVWLKSNNASGDAALWASWLRALPGRAFARAAELTAWVNGPAGVEDVLPRLLRRMPALARLGVRFGCTDDEPEADGADEPEANGVDEDVGGGYGVAQTRVAGALFAALGGACPALEELALDYVAEFGGYDRLGDTLRRYPREPGATPHRAPDGLVPPLLVGALAARAAAGAPLRRLVLQPWALDGYVTLGHPPARDDVDRELGRAAGRLVGAYEVPRSTAPAVPFVLRHSWRGAEGADTYWTVPTEDPHGYYRLPWKVED